MTSPTNTQPFRFQISHLLYLTGVYATGLALTPDTLIATTLWMIFCVSIWRLDRDRKILWVGLGLFFGSCCCLFPTVNNPGHIVNYQRQCSNNQRQLMLGMLNYESAHLVFPDGQPKKPGDPPHSWRVAILPFIEHPDLYDQYDFSEPWDGPNNSKLLSQMPDLFRCPTPSQLSDNKTTYKVINGPGSLFDEGVAPTFDSIQDGSSNTAAIVEDAGNPVPWTKPEGISIEQAVQIYSNPSHKFAPHLHETLFNRSYFSGSIACYDSSTHLIGQFKDPADAAKLFGINDGIAFLDNTQQFFRTETRYNKVIAAVVYAIFMLAPLFVMPWKNTAKKQLRQTPSCPDEAQLTDD